MLALMLLYDARYSEKRDICRLGLTHIKVPDFSLLSVKRYPFSLVILLVAIWIKGDDLAVSIAEPMPPLGSVPSSPPSLGQNHVLTLMVINTMPFALIARLRRKHRLTFTLCRLLTILRLSTVFSRPISGSFIHSWLVHRAGASR